MNIDIEDDRFVTSDSPDTLKAIADRDKERKEWLARADDFRREYGVHPWMAGRECVGVSEHTDRLPGRWTRTSPSRPFKSNAEGFALLAGLARVEVEAERLDGVADVHILDGAAYARLTGGDVPDWRLASNGWRPCPAWQWVRAVEEGA